MRGLIVLILLIALAFGIYFFFPSQVPEFLRFKKSDQILVNRTSGSKTNRATPVKKSNDPNYYECVDLAFRFESPATLIDKVITPKARALNLAKGDRLVSVNGAPVMSLVPARQLCYDLKKNKPVKFVIERGEKQYNVQSPK